MNKKLIPMVTVAFLLVVGVFLIPSVAATNYTCDSCDSCTSYMANSTATDVVQLTQDIVNGSTTCLTITDVYDVDFDCNGYVLECNGTGANQPFVDVDNWTSSTMSNCEITLNGQAGFTLVDTQDISDFVFEDIIINVSGGTSYPTFSVAGLASNTILRDVVVYYDNNVSGESVFVVTNPYNMTIDNVSIYSTGNGRGLYIYDVENGAGYEATITNSIFQNLQIGVYAFKSGGGETNLFYNNIFNSTDNYLENNALVNHFNTTKTLGTNIVGGPYIGGNWWEGFSNTCNDTNDDGICDDTYTDSGDTDYLPLSIPPIIYTDFSSDPETTNFSAEADLTNVTDPVLANSYAKIEWSGSGFDAAGANFDAALNYGTNLVDVNTVTIPTFDAPATVTLKGVTYPDTALYMILRDGVECTTCVKLSSTPATFTVPGFSNYTTSSIPVTQSNPLLALIPLIMAVALVLGFVGAFLSGLLDLQTMIKWMVMAVIAITFIGVIFLI